MDGWNNIELESLMSVLEDIYDLQYELKNCVRGCYTGCTTYPELAKYIEDLADKLNVEASDIKYIADEAETDEDE